MTSRSAIGIQDVASAAQVSASTVSNVLNGRDDRMRPETRKRVLEAIERLGYRPSALARQLKTGQSRSIGLIVPSVANPFWGAVAHQVERAAMEFGYKVLFCNAERNPETERTYAEMLLSSGARGVIFSSSPLTFEHLASLVERGLIVAALDQGSRGAEEVVACSVSVDNELGGRLIAQHLLGLGHRRIGFISGPIRTHSRLARLRGFREALEDFGVGFEPSLVWDGNAVIGFGDTEGAELGRTGARELLSARRPPTAIFAINDLYALGAYAGARDMGLDVPGDVSIVGFDDIALAEIVHPSLTTVRQPVAAMARAAVASLIRRVEGSGSEEPAHVGAIPHLIVRRSTASAHANASRSLQQTAASPPREDAPKQETARRNR